MNDTDDLDRSLDLLVQDEVFPGRQDAQVGPDVRTRHANARHFGNLPASLMDAVEPSQGGRGAILGNVSRYGLKIGFRLRT